MNQGYNENMKKIFIDGLKNYLESHLNEKDKKVYQAVESSIDFLESMPKLDQKEAKEYQEIILNIVGADVIRRIVDNITTSSIQWEGQFCGGEGAEVVYALRNDDTLAKSILEELEKAGQKGRKYYQRRLPENPSKDYYFIQRLTGDT